MSPVLPLELYNEFISYLWNDKKALSACSLANRILTVPSQKLLFHQVILHSAPNDWEEERSPSDFFVGTSSAFHILLENAPHIAGYVQCLQIFDVDVRNGDDADSSEHWSDGAWLPKDTFLPICLPLLCNLKAFVLFYVPDWGRLGEAVRRSLQDLIRLPSLVFVDLAPSPTLLLADSFDNNLKHLIILEGDYVPTQPLTPPQPSSCSPIYLETLFVSEDGAAFLEPLTSDPKFRFKTSQLRKLALDTQTDRTFQYLLPLLQSCRQTLEEFTFIPCTRFLLDPDASAPPIDLSQMTSLKTLTLFLDSSPFLCFNNLLRSASSIYQTLEDLTVIMGLCGRSFTDSSHIQYWNEASDVLLTPSRFPRLRKLTLHITDEDSDGSNFIALLDASESMEQLRARAGIKVVTKFIKNHMSLWNFAPDKRWENIGFNML